MISGICEDDDIPLEAYFWTAQGSASYYVHITSSSGNSDEKFFMTLVAGTSYDEETSPRKSYLRKKA
ncbi:hypothetical protein ACHAW5_004242 [Stephanodiscus triporus]|uniref:Uncharacterized protein n=1 Tax=Stephanodiscus triporus TaxID=2934178 RepID=A0ABD3NKQ9_9STRA